MRRSRLLASTMLATTIAMPLSIANDVVFRGNLHSSINNARLSINSFDQLVVGNLSPAGNDGVSIHLGQAESFDLFILPLPPGTPVGTNENFTAQGAVSGVPNISFADFGFTRTSSNITVDATFSGLGPGPRVIEVFFAGTLVGTFTQTASIPQVASLPPTAWPRQVGVRRNLAPQNRPALVCKWTAPQPIDLTVGPTITGDELRVVAMVPTNTLDLVSSIDGTGSDVPELFIDNEDTQPTCPGDLDGDGDVDIADLTILLSNFGAMGNLLSSQGDLDSDGDVDISDLTAMLGYFGSMC